jgi:hypothetical protein
MGALTFIPIDCWLCGDHYRVPATLSLMPVEFGNVYTQQVGANVWVHVDQTMIQAHVQAHWPILVLWFHMWRAFTDVSGIDVFDYFTDWGDDASAW